MKLPTCAVGILVIWIMLYGSHQFKMNQKIACTNHHIENATAKFCGQCGDENFSPVSYCTNYHEVFADEKYCSKCGLPPRFNRKWTSKDSFRQHRKGLRILISIAVAIGALIVDLWVLVPLWHDLAANRLEQVLGCEPVLDRRRVVGSYYFVWEPIRPIGVEFICRVENEDVTVGVRSNFSARRATALGYEMCSGPYFTGYSLDPILPVGSSLLVRESLVRHFQRSALYDSLCR